MEGINMKLTLDPKPQLRIDPEIRDSIRPQTEAEFKQLESNILADGEVREPLVVWNGVIVDGHHRWKIIQAHPELPFTVKEMNFADKYAAIIWMCKKQLGQRNCTAEEISYLRGKQYEAEKQRQGGDHGNQYTTKVASAQNEQLPKSREEIKSGTAGRIGKEYGVGSATIRRDADFAVGLDTAEKVSPGMKVDVLSGKVKVPKSLIAALSSMDADEQKQTVQDIKEGKTLRTPKAKSERTSSKGTFDESIQKIAADLKADKPPVEDEPVAVIISSMIKEFSRKLRMTLAEHSTEITEENSKKIIAALSEAGTAINEMKGLVAR